MFYFNFYEIVIWVATLIFCVIANFCRKAPLRKPGGIGQPLPNPISVILPIIFFTIFTGARKNIGDTFYYALSFDLMPTSDNPVTAELFFTGMFSFFQNIIRNLSQDSQWLVAFSGLFSIPIPLIILYKYSYPYDLSLYLFVAYGYLGGMMNGMRQYMAATIVICGTRYLFSLKRFSFIKYAVIIILAWSMHNSALIMIPVYFIVRRKSWQLSSYVLVLGSVVVTVAFDAIMPSFLEAVENTSYSNYSANGWFTSGKETGSSIGRALAAAAPIVLAYLNKDRMKRFGHIGDILINISFLNLALSIVALYNWIFIRVTIYFMIYYIILTVWIVYNAVKPKDRSLYCVLFIIAFFFYSRYLGYLISSYESNYFFPNRQLFRRP